MVAEVIRFPSVTFNSLQTGQSGQTVRQVGVVNNSNNNLPASDVNEAVINTESVRQATSELNEFAKQIQTNLNFSVDEASGRSIITVTDSQTGDVIRQIPAKEVLAVANLLREFIASDSERVGLLFAGQG